MAVNFILLSFKKILALHLYKISILVLYQLKVLLNVDYFKTSAKNQDNPLMLQLL